MSEIRVENIIGETGADAVKFTKGINVTGIVTATNVSIGSSVTATSFFGSGAGLSGVSAGKILQAKHTFKNDAWTASAPSNWSQITGLSVTITAASTSNKLLFVCNLMYGQGTQAVFCARLYDGTNEITASRSTVSSTANYNGWIADYNKSSSSSHSSDNLNNATASYLHTPTDTNSHTYNIYARAVEGGAIYINRRGSDASFGGTSSFYVYEIEA